MLGLEISRRQAERHASRGRYQAAIQIYRRLLAVHVEDDALALRLADLLALAGEPAQADDVCRQLVIRYRRRGDLDRAVALLRRLLRRTPDDTRLSFELAEIYETRGLLAEARALYDTLGERLEADGSSAVLDVYERLLVLEPDEPLHHIRMAQRLWSYRLFERAAGHAGRARWLAGRRGGDPAAVYLRITGVDAEDRPAREAAARLLETAGDRIGARLLRTLDDPRAASEAGPGAVLDFPLAAPGSAPRADHPAPLDDIEWSLA